MKRRQRYGCGGPDATRQFSGPARVGPGTLRQHGALLRIHFGAIPIAGEIAAEIQQEPTLVILNLISINEALSL
jgi:hypothetical protein